tara:strand:+ start:33320 stop:34045 length:726 start_codon:yes stop_codon:yes gene_type:complete
MWFLLAGNLLSLFAYSIYCNYLFEAKTITKTKCLLGWFLIEHSFEEYNTTAGKLFLVYEDFRQLITNLLSISRNVFFIAQYFTPVEFVFVNLVIFLIVFIYKKKLSLSTIKSLIVFSYYVILNSFLFIDLTNLNKIFVLYLLIIILIFYFSIFYYLLFFKLSHIKISNIYFKLIITKMFTYSSTFLAIFSSIIVSLSSFITINENFVQEFVLNNLVLYLYFYCFKFELKCLQLINFVKKRG